MRFKIFGKRVGGGGSNIALIAAAVSLPMAMTASTSGSLLQAAAQLASIPATMMPTPPVQTYNASESLNIIPDAAGVSQRYGGGTIDLDDVFDPPIRPELAQPEVDSPDELSEEDVTIGFDDDEPEPAPADPAMDSFFSTGVPPLQDAVSAEDVTIGFDDDVKSEPAPADPAMESFFSTGVPPLQDAVSAEDVTIGFDDDVEPEPAPADPAMESFFSTGVPPLQDAVSAEEITMDFKPEVSITREEEEPEVSITREEEEPEISILRAEETDKEIDAEIAQALADAAALRSESSMQERSTNNTLINKVQASVEAMIRSKIYADKKIPSGDKKTVMEAATGKMEQLIDQIRGLKATDAQKTVPLNKFIDFKVQQLADAGLSNKGLDNKLKHIGNSINADVAAAKLAVKTNAAKPVENKPAEDKPKGPSKSENAKPDSTMKSESSMQERSTNNTLIDKVQASVEAMIRKVNADKKIPASDKKTIVDAATGKMEQLMDQIRGLKATDAQKTVPLNKFIDFKVQQLADAGLSNKGLDNKLKDIGNSINAEVAAAKLAVKTNAAKPVENKPAEDKPKGPSISERVKSTIAGWTTSTPAAPKADALDAATPVVPAAGKFTVDLRTDGKSAVINLQSPTASQSMQAQAPPAKDGKVKDLMQIISQAYKETTHREIDPPKNCSTQTFAKSEDFKNSQTFKSMDAADKQQYATDFPKKVVTVQFDSLAEAQAFIANLKEQGVKCTMLKSDEPVMQNENAAKSEAEGPKQEQEQKQAQQQEQTAAQEQQAENKQEAKEEMKNDEGPEPTPDAEPEPEPEPDARTSMRM
jgi:hypothetical protein